jgi:hypothetical protein
MRRYYFHIQQIDNIIHDQEGLELKDCDAVRDEALTGARQIMADAVKAGVLDLSCTMSVDDDEGRAIYRLPFSDALTVRRW